MTLPSLVASNTQTLDKTALVRLTNRAQAIALELANDQLVPEKAREFYNQANEMFKKAMREACEPSR
jgi:hypothetical protein